MNQWLTAVIDGQVCHISDAEYEAIVHGSEDEREAALTAALLRKDSK